MQTKNSKTPKRLHGLTSDQTEAEQRLEYNSFMLLQSFLPQIVIKGAKWSKLQVSIVPVSRNSKIFIFQHDVFRHAVFSSKRQPECKYEQTQSNSVVLV